MKCPKCGHEMKEDERCCLRCGELNYSNPMNKDYLKRYGDKRKFIKENSFIFKKRNNRRKLLLIGLIVLVIIIAIVMVYILRSK